MIPHMKPLLITTLALSGFALLNPPSAGGHSAVEPVPRSDQPWKDRQETLNNRATEAGAKAEVIFIGDSITQGWEGEGKEAWGRYYAPRNAVNLGIGGDRTQHVLWRLDNGNLNGLKPKAAVVMIGTNNSNGEDNTVDQIADGISAIVTKLRDKLPDTAILLLSIFPRGENPNPQRGKILQVNQIVRRLADEKKVFWVDFGHKFVTAAGEIPRDLMPDFLHLSAKGYALWAAELATPLASILGGTAAAPAATPVASAGPRDLTGEWTATMPGPNGEPIDIPFTLQQRDGTLTGKFGRGDGRWLEIEAGKLNGNELSWVIKRDRPQGGTMTYHMTGKVENGAIKGQTRTDLDGNELTLEWTGKRK